jgi:hypothetical protein
MTLSRGRGAIAVLTVALAFAAAFAASRASAGGNHAARLPTPLILPQTRVTIQRLALPSAPPMLHRKRHRNAPASEPTGPSNPPTAAPAEPSSPTAPPPSSSPPSGGGKGGGPVIVG